MLKKKKFHWSKIKRDLKWLSLEWCKGMTIDPDGHRGSRPVKTSIDQHGRETDNKYPAGNRPFPIAA